MAANALKPRPIKSRSKAARKAGKNVVRTREPKPGFIVTGRREIEEKRQQIRERLDPNARLYGARGYRNLARELQALISNDEERSLTAIARETGLTMLTVKNIWAGRTRRPSFQTVEAIYALYGLDLASNRRLSVVR